ncbi:diaminopimelate epimerase [Paenibacillus methanolicus]|uniref:Diaminopimelate epimerase n=1 Tax=Paenibacillus methanolicus TaxID=582686 RepID=A0A5S5CDJ2_9BACL|nr:diaminopimelate epimerase [Paenibacillus methanolicus]TYP76420.1 diaminopimelate epimerase [Paenibacillus methanolicus]
MRREIDFVKCNPTQNMTILVKTDHPEEEHKPIASKIMAYDNVYAEQVGFITKSGRREAAASLQMAGGEFCGNACMALAVYIASMEDGRRLDWKEIVLEASGTDHLVRCQVRRSADDYQCRISMPVPNKIEQRAIRYEGLDLDLAIVRYPDFIHIVLEVEQFADSARDTAQSLAKLLGVTLGSNVIGILLYKAGTGEMAPLIYVPPLDSLVWERGCGSGTASVGAYLAWKHGGAIAAPIRQPGGTIHVAAQCDNGEITRLSIEGVVGIVAEGKAYVEIQESISCTLFHRPCISPEETRIAANEGEAVSP